MNPDVFEMEIRKFLKRFGVTSQREIEQAVRAAIAAGKLKGNEPLAVVATLKIPQLGASFDIEGNLTLE